MVGEVVMRACMIVCVTGGGQPIHVTNSAKTRVNVDEAFHQAIREVRKFRAAKAATRASVSGGRQQGGGTSDGGGAARKSKCVVL